MKQFHHYSIITPFRIKSKVYFAVALVTTVQYFLLSLCVDGRISPKASMTYSLGHPDMDVDFGTYSLLTVIYTVQFTAKLVVPLPRGKHFKLVFVF